MLAIEPLKLLPVAMPVFLIQTNVPRERFPSDFMSKMTEILVKALGKPENFVSITVQPGLWMSVGRNSDEPCAICTLCCIGKLGEKENVSHSAAIMGYLYESLGISQERMYLNFNDAKSSEVGYKGSTFAAL